jgi:hypothetical protein
MRGNVHVRFGERLGEPGLLPRAPSRLYTWLFTWLQGALSYGLMRKYWSVGKGSMELPRR